MKESALVYITKEGRFYDIYFNHTHIYTRARISILDISHNAIYMYFLLFISIVITV